MSGGVLTEPERLWVFDTFDWVLRNFGAEYFYNETRLVLPTEDFFLFEAGMFQCSTTELFGRVQSLAGMDRYNCELVEIKQSRTDSIIGSPSETFEDCLGYTEFGRNGTPTITVITFDGLSPISLVATMAHEFAHVLGETADTPPPGDGMADEEAVDLLALALGFGLWLVGSSKSMEANTSYSGTTWVLRYAGYLNTDQLLFSLAVFCELKGIPRDGVVEYLSPSYSEIFDRCRFEVLGDCADELLRLRERFPHVNG